MEIILKQDVENIGHKDQIIDVRPGYANNFLIPQGYATAATKSAKKVHAENLKQRAHKEEKIVKDATAIAEKLSALSLIISAKASELGKLFGAITTADIAADIAKKGIEVDKRDIKTADIKELGSHTATIKIYKDIVATVSIEVIAAE